MALQDLAVAVGREMRKVSLRRSMLAVAWQPRRFVLGAACAAAALLPPVAVPAQTLFEAMLLAYGTNPALQAQRAAVRAAAENVSQALAGSRPTVILEGGTGVIHRFDSRTSDSDTPLSAALTVTQPVYRGGRTAAATRRAENQVRAARANLVATEQTVLLSVVRAYLDVLRDEAVVRLSRNNEQVLARQLQAARDRFEVGEVTRTDVAQAEARLSRAASDRIQAEGNLISSRANYRRAVGAAPGRLAAAPRPTDIPASHEDAVQIALAQNPLLAAAGFDEAASRYAVAVSRGSLLPTVSLSGDLTYNDAQPANVGPESATLIARVTVPLYQSGAARSQLRRDREVNAQRRIRVEETRRQVVESVTTAWQRLTTASARIVSRLEQVRAAELALEGVRQEAEVGSRTTLDVLDAEQELLDAQVALVRAQRDEYVAAFEVKSAIGRLTVAALGLAAAADEETGAGAADE